MPAASGDHQAAPQVVLAPRAIEVVQADPVVCRQDHVHLAHFGGDEGDGLRQDQGVVVGHGEDSAELQVEGEGVRGVGATILLVGVGAPTAADRDDEGVGRAKDRSVLHLEAGRSSSGAELVNAPAGHQGSRALTIKAVAENGGDSSHRGYTPGRTYRRHEQSYKGGAGRSRAHPSLLVD